VSTLLLVRHGLTALTGPVLAGHTPDLHLDERGRKQADAVAQRIAALPLSAIVTSSLDRCLETAGAIRSAQQAAGREPAWHVDDGLIECRYGDWTGKQLKDLAKDPMWKVVQTQPSAARFPGGESLAEVSARAVATVRAWDAQLGDDAIWVACSHGDVIKAVLADALGLHLDQFQRIAVDPCSVSVVRYTAARPYVLRSNDVGGDLAAFAPPKRRRRGSDNVARKRGSDDAAVGGGSGAGAV
jgi:probable phosphomutase (TIGR03848 family)